MSNLVTEVSDIDLRNDKMGINYFIHTDGLIEFAKSSTNVLIELQSIVLEIIPDSHAGDNNLDNENIFFLLI